MKGAEPLPHSVPVDIVGLPQAADRPAHKWDRDRPTPLFPRFCKSTRVAGSVVSSHARVGYAYKLVDKPQVAFLL